MLTVVQYQGNDGRQATWSFGSGQLLLPDPHHVPQELEQGESLRLALVLDEQVDIGGSSSKLGPKQPVAVETPEGLVHEAGRNWDQRRRIEQAKELRRQHCLELPSGIARLGEQFLEQRVVRIVRSRHASRTRSRIRAKGGTVKNQWFLRGHGGAGLALDGGWPGNGMVAPSPAAPWLLSVVSPERRLPPPERTEADRCIGPGSRCSLH